MSDLKFAYAVARIRVLEKNLLSDADIDQMIGMPDASRVAAFLKERGWGSPETGDDPDRMFSEEETKTWALAGELKIDPKILEIFSYQTIYHNLKAAIKTMCSGDNHPGIFLAHETWGKERMVKLLQEKDFKALPEHMRKAAEEAYTALLHTRDGQMCDVIIDRACLEAIAAAGRASKVEVIRDYADMFVTMADIKIAVRAAGTGKDAAFLNRALVGCDSINVRRLIAAAVIGKNEIISYLAETKYAGAAEALGKSASAFERWCDNQLIEKLKPQKINPFSAGPVVAWMLARENEIKTARIIMTAKANGLPEAAIRERARIMYV